MKIDIQLSKKISVLSGFWMIAIVCFHSSHGVRAVWYSELMSDCRLAGVGFFFAVSGFFLMRKDAWGGEGRKAVWREAVRTRIRSLGVPYLLWNMAGWALNRHFDEDIFHAFGLVGVAPSANGPLWYVKFLFLFVLVSPLVAVVIEKCGRWTFVLCSGMMLVIPFCPFPMKFSLFFSFSFFILGSVCARCPIHVQVKRTGRFLVLTALVCMWAGMYVLRLNHHDVFFMQMYGSCLAVAVFWLIVPKALLRSCPDSIRAFPTFFVFCSHMLILHKMPAATSVVGAMIIGCASFLLSAGTAMIVRRVSSKLYGVLTGGRS